MRSIGLCPVLHVLLDLPLAFPVGPFLLLGQLLALSLSLRHDLVLGILGVCVVHKGVAVVEDPLALICGLPVLLHQPLLVVLACQVLPACVARAWLREDGGADPATRTRGMW